jgi:hypothetical protein
MCSDLQCLDHVSVTVVPARLWLIDGGAESRSVMSLQNASRPRGAIERTLQVRAHDTVSGTHRISPRSISDPSGFTLTVFTLTARRDTADGWPTRWAWPAWDEAHVLAGPGALAVSQTAKAMWDNGMQQIICYRLTAFRALPNISGLLLLKANIA